MADKDRIRRRIESLKKERTHVVIRLEFAKEEIQKIDKLIEEIENSLTSEEEE